MPTLEEEKQLGKVEQIHLKCNWSLLESWQDVITSMLPKEIKASFACNQQVFSSPAAPARAQF